MSIKPDHQYDVILDARKDRCPMPLLKTKMALSSMKCGERLSMVTCDSGSLKDIPKYVDLIGCVLISMDKGDDTYTFVIQKN